MGSSSFFTLQIPLPYIVTFLSQHSYFNIHAVAAVEIFAVFLHQLTDDGGGVQAGILGKCGRNHLQRLRKLWIRYQCIQSITDYFFHSVLVKSRAFFAKGSNTNRHADLRTAGTNDKTRIRAKSLDRVHPVIYTSPINRKSVQ